MIFAASTLVLTSVLAWSFRDRLLAKFLKFVPLSDHAPRQILPKRTALVYETERSLSYAGDATFAQTEGDGARPAIAVACRAYTYE